MSSVDRGTELGILLFVASRRLEEVAYDAAVAAGATITLAQSRLLARIAPGGSRITELAAQSRVTKQTAAHLVDQLAASGHVERVPDPRDGRARLVRLTEPALAMVPEADSAVRTELRRWRDHLGDARMGELLASLREVAELADPWRAADGEGRPHGG
ncbi:MarR family winged helix-turn-helix transcriptional regulator [Nocardioides insulae]|uniref:MarR family winged helix-turn-helix transcriptional regulator n=1 Tax=Nocardioides insulae TaxID=394734 RepID=UPI00042166A0|nr:MarR family transcriptional regulator [Nocardioides insulae]